MRATRVEDLEIYHLARSLMTAVFDAARPFHSDFWLADQLNDSAESVLANISEGFRQPTDRAFARYLGIAASSAEECRSHLVAAGLRGHISPSRAAELRSNSRGTAASPPAFSGPSTGSTG